MKWLLLALALFSAGCGTSKRVCIEITNSLGHDITITALTGLPFPFDRETYQIKDGATMNYHIPKWLKMDTVKIEVKR